ncbi:guanylate kinase [bacterium]|nr:guanylate kinase [bacterium]
MKTKGILLVVSAPSGCGKTTICGGFLNKYKDISYCISTTTRTPRAGEKNGVDYFFVPEKFFKSMIKQEKFLEYAKVFNNFYGTSKEAVLKLLDNGNDVLIDIDTQGARQIRKIVPASVQVFIMPPSIKILRERLTNRGKDSKEVIDLRLSEAKNELEQSRFYDYIIINETVEASVEQLRSILIAERLREKRKKRVIEKLLEGK